MTSARHLHRSEKPGAAFEASVDYQPLWRIHRIWPLS